MFIKKRKYMDEINHYRQRNERIEMELFRAENELKKQKVNNLMFSTLRRLLDHKFSIEINKQKLSISRNNLYGNYNLPNYIEDYDFANALEQAEIDFLTHREEEIEKIVAQKKSGE